MTIKSKIFILLFFLFFLLNSCSKQKIEKIEIDRFLFGTNLKIVIYSEDKENSEKLIEETFTLMENVEKKYNSRSEESIVYKLNKNPLVAQKIDSELFFMLNKAREISELTKGTYDISVGPLMSLWGFDDLDIKKIPSEIEIENAQKLVNYKDIIFDENKIALKKESQRIDTGSFLKGYAINKGAEYLRDKGVKSAMITAISSIETIGAKPEDKPFKIGVQNPKNSQELLYTINLKDKALGVSGDYQTFVEIEGKVFHHILDAKTGYPANHNSMVLVLGTNAFECDLLSTGLFTLEAREIIAYIDSREELEAFLVDIDGKEYFSKNIKSYMKK